MQYYAVTFDRPDRELKLTTFDKKVSAVLEGLGFHRRADAYWIGASVKTLDELYDTFDKALPYVCEGVCLGANNLVVTQVVAVKERYKPVGVDAMEKCTYRHIAVSNDITF